MLTHVELRLGLVVLQIVVLQLRFFPVHRQNFVIKIRIIVHFTDRNILDEVTQILPDVLKFIDSGSLHIVCMQNLVDQLSLYHNFRDVRHRCNSGNFLKQVAAGFSVFLSGEIGKLDAIHQRVEPQRLGIVLFRCNERCKLLPHEQRVLIGQGIVTVRFGIPLHIFQVLSNRKIILVQLLHLAHHVLHQRLAEGNQVRRLIRQVL